MGFWDVIAAEIAELRTAKTADQVIEIMNKFHEPSAGDAFFAGGGGDLSISEALTDAGWTYVWAEADYYYVLRSPDGKSMITYCEGDVYKGDTSIRK